MQQKNSSKDSNIKKDSNDNDDIYKKLPSRSSAPPSSSPLLIDTSTIYDLSHVINHEMPTYVGEPSPEFQPVSKLAKGKANVTKIIIGSHTGTHVDAPRHFLPNGQGIDNVPLTRYVGEAVVMDVSAEGIGHGIDSEDLERHSAGAAEIRDGDILLLYTGTSEQWGKGDSARTHFSYLDSSGADWIVNHKIKCVGIDTFSMERYGFEEGRSHEKLLSKGIGIIEGLNSSLGHFVGKRVFFVCIPLRLGDLDGSPARPVIFPMH